MSVGHGEIRLVGDQCVVPTCSKPARELGGLCTACWMGLTRAEREHLVWLRDVDRRVVADEIKELSALYALDAVEPHGRAA